jgi:hypothetical protein
MKCPEIVIATITLARGPEEERGLLDSIQKLAATGLPLVIADGGSRKQFVRKLKALANDVVMPEKKGLVLQVKAAFFAALRQFPDKRAILYTEPDKYPFFEGGIFELIRGAGESKRFGVAVASRDGKSFRTFPKGQQEAESFMNEAFSWVIRRKGDFCYGPLLLSRRAAELALDAPNHLGWGWRFWTMQKAHAAGLRITPIELSVPCPKEQRGEDSLADRLYRLKQLKQNVEALL